MKLLAWGETGIFLLLVDMDLSLVSTNLQIQAEFRLSRARKTRYRGTNQMQALWEIRLEVSGYAFEAFKSMLGKS